MLYLNFESFKTFSIKMVEIYVFLQNVSNVMLQHFPVQKCSMEMFLVSTADHAMGSWKDISSHRYFL